MIRTILKTLATEELHEVNKERVNNGEKPLKSVFDTFQAMSGRRNLDDSELRLALRHPDERVLYYLLSSRKFSTQINFEQERWIYSEIMERIKRENVLWAPLMEAMIRHEEGKKGEGYWSNDTSRDWASTSVKMLLESVSTFENKEDVESILFIEVDSVRERCLSILKVFPEELVPALTGRGKKDIKALVQNEKFSSFGKEIYKGLADYLTHAGMLRWQNAEYVDYKNIDVQPMTVLIELLQKGGELTSSQRQSLMSGLVSFAGTDDGLGPFSVLVVEGKLSKQEILMAMNLLMLEPEFWKRRGSAFMDLKSVDAQVLRTALKEYSLGAEVRSEMARHEKVRTGREFQDLFSEDNAITVLSALLEQVEPEAKGRILMQVVDRREELGVRLLADFAGEAKGIRQKDWAKLLKSDKRQFRQAAVLALGEQHTRPEQVLNKTGRKR